MATFEQLKNTINTKWNLIETDMIHKANTQWQNYGSIVFYQEERRLFLMRMADKLCCVIYSSLVRLCKMQNLKYCFIVFKTRWQNYGSISLSVY